MIVENGYQKRLMERIGNIEEIMYKTYTCLEEEELKVYYTFAHQYISNILNLVTISRWNAGGYIIESQTGSGKSTLMLKTVIPLAKKRNKRVAIIVPRVALAMQYKKDLSKEYAPELLKNLTDEGLQRQRTFDNADVYTLQEFVNYGIRKEFTDNSLFYEFVILDEVHAFVGDAAFNVYTYDIFSYLVSSSQYTKRIYITATLDIVAQEIVDVEHTIPEYRCIGYDQQYVGKNEVTVLYRFRYDYSFLTLMLFTKEATGIELIKHTHDGEKTLVFVQSKAKGLALRDLLGKDKAVFIDAESKRTSEVDNFRQIVNESICDRQFLIVTKFLDVGVNLLDEAVHDVFVFHQYKEEVIQMLGRKRITKAENVTLHLYVPSLTEVKREIDELKCEYQRYTSDLKTYEEINGCYNKLPIPLYMEKIGNDWKVKCNYYAYRLNFYHQEQLKEFVKIHEEDDYYEHYAQVILKWFPQCMRLLWIDRTQKSDIKDNVCAMLEPLIGLEYDKEKAVKIAHDILRIFNVARRKEQENSMPITMLKKIFLEHSIPYVFRNLSREGKKGVYVVERGCDWQ